MEGLCHAPGVSCETGSATDRGFTGSVCHPSVHPRNAAHHYTSRPPRGPDQSSTQPSRLTMDSSGDGTPRRSAYGARHPSAAASVASASTYSGHIPNLTCYLCGGVGHMPRDCPSPWTGLVHCASVAGPLSPGPPSTSSLSSAHDTGHVNIVTWKNSTPETFIEIDIAGNPPHSPFF